MQWKINKAVEIDKIRRLLKLEDLLKIALYKPEGLIQTREILAHSLNN